MAAGTTSACRPSPITGLPTSSSTTVSELYRNLVRSPWSVWRLPGWVGSGAARQENNRRLEFAVNDPAPAGLFFWGPAIILRRHDYLSPWLLLVAGLVEIAIAGRGDGPARTGRAFRLPTTVAGAGRGRCCRQPPDRNSPAAGHAGWFLAGRAFRQQSGC